MHHEKRGLEEAQAGIKIVRRNINNLKYADDTTLMAESEEELKSLLMKVKEESKKVGLKLNIQKTKIMAFGPITSWQIDGGTVETVSDFLGGSKITADGDCSHEIKRRLLLGRKVMTTLDSISKAETLLCHQSPSSQDYGFSSGHVWMWELDCGEAWAPKNWCFWSVVLEKTLESPLDCKEIQPVHSKGDQPWMFFARNDAKAETPVLWPPNVKSWLIGKDSDPEMDGGQEEKGKTEDKMAGWHHQLDGLSLNELLALVMDREAWRAVIHGVAKSRTRLRDWTELNWKGNLTLYITITNSNKFISNKPHIFVKSETK